MNSGASQSLSKLKLSSFVSAIISDSDDSVRVIQDFLSDGQDFSQLTDPVNAGNLSTVIHRVAPSRRGVDCAGALSTSDSARNWETSGFDSSSGVDGVCSISRGMRQSRADV